jgi:ribosomal-protein-alanine N-acetyltransferase
VILAGGEAVALLLERREQVDALARVGLGKLDFDIGAELERPYALAWVAREDADVIGFLLGWQVADELHVLDVVVAERARRRGVGRALVDAAMNDAVARSLRVALLEVRRANVAARTLYRAAGFVAVRLRPGYYDDPVDDAVEMARELAPGALVEFERLIED